MWLRVAALLFIAAPLLFGQERHTVDVYKIRASGQGNPKEIPPELEIFAKRLEQMSFRFFTLMEKVSKEVAVGQDLEYALGDRLTMVVTLLEKIQTPEGEVQMRVQINVLKEDDKGERKSVTRFISKVKLKAAATLFGVPSEGLAPDGLLIGIDVQ